MKNKKWFKNWSRFRVVHLMFERSILTRTKPLSDVFNLNQPTPCRAVTFKIFLIIHSYELDLQVDFWYLSNREKKHGYTYKRIHVSFL